MPSHLTSPIFVTGLPRSGTSMIAGCLAACGAWTGTTVRGNDENPKGYYEHVNLRESIVKQALLQLGCDPLGIRKLPPEELGAHIQGLDEIILNIIRADGYDGSTPWLYKDAKLTLLWPMFVRAFPNASWVVATRDTGSFVASCLRTSFMKQHSLDPHFWEQLADQYQSRLANLVSSDAKILKISTPEIIEGDLSGFEKVVDELGLAFDEHEVREFIDPGFWNRPNETEG